MNYFVGDFPDDLRAWVRQQHSQKRARSEIASDVKARWPQFDGFKVHHVDRIVQLGDEPPPKRYRKSTGQEKPAGSCTIPTAEGARHYYRTGSRTPVQISLGGPSWSRPVRFQS